MRIAVTCLLLMLATASMAVNHFDDSELRARYQALTHQLRCVVCLNQNIAESAAPLAADMRNLVAERIRAGDSDDVIKHILVERYGTFVLYKPPFSPATWALWLGPAVILLIGLLIGALLLRRRKGEASPPVTVDEARLARLLADREYEDRHS